MRVNKPSLAGIVFAILIIGLSATGFAGQPFAPRPAVPADITETYLGKSASNAVIPDQERVGIPAYPGAVVIRSYAIESRPPKYKGLPIVELITTDDYQTVVDYYKKALPSWRNAELLSAYYFAKYGNLNFFTPQEPHVGIHKMDNYYLATDRNVLRKMHPGAKTLIKVFFEK